MTEYRDGDPVIYVPSWGSEWTAVVELLPDPVETPGAVRIRLTARRDGVKSGDEGRVIVPDARHVKPAGEVLW
jgi:hypothetical protein